MDAEDADPPPARLTRRRALRLIGGAALALAPVLRAGEAAAARQWCRVDPVFRIGGQTAHVRVAASVKNMRAARALATGPTRVALAVPAGVAAEHVADDAGFGHGYEVEVEEAADLDGTGGVLPVRVAVTVPMAEDGVPVRAEFVPAGSAGRLRPGGGEGVSNAEVAFVAA